jgi:hypothetical protein
MRDFKFQGDWTTTLQLEAFKGFCPVLDGTENDGMIRLILLENVASNPDPLPEQLAAIDYILANQTRIAQVIIQFIRDDYPNLIQSYDVGDDENNDLPLEPFQRDEQVQKLIRPSTLYVQCSQRKGVSHTNFVIQCNWDSEHGLSLDLHQDQILSWAYCYPWLESFDTPELCDNAELVAQIRHETNAHWGRKPVFRYPHPKYGKWKESEKEENEKYALQLISENQVDLFREYIEITEKYGLYATKNQKEGFKRQALFVESPAILAFLASKGWT